MSRRWVLTAGFFLPAAIVAGGGWFAPPRTHGRVGAPTAQPDWGKLQHLPFSAVIGSATDGDTFGLAVERTRADTVARIAARPAELRRLTWLAELAHGWGQDGLHSLFAASGADFAPEIGQALAESGLTRQADVFARAMALCGTPYPRDLAVRAALFARTKPERQADQPTSVPDGPNSFNRALMALGTAFGSLDEYWQAVEGVVKRSPALSSYAEAQRAAMSDSDRMDWLIGQLFMDGPEDMKPAIRSWPRPFQSLYLLGLLNGEVRNGGVSQFFFNASGALAPEAAAALREAGLPEQADAVQRGIGMFRVPYPTDTVLRRAEYFRTDGTTPFDSALDTLTGDVDDAAIGLTMIALAKREGIMPY